uniref:Carboxylesterase type B domain-containing protein n=1 Tax=Acrobeloides nanus TaxID=290746 RepID=A0A914D092_9BILA
MLLTTLNKYAPKLVDKNPNIIDVLADIFSSNIRDDDNLGWLKILSQIFSGAFFTSFTGREVDFYLLNNNLNVYLYEFTWPTHLFHALDVAGWSPVQHATERYYIWMPEKLWDPTIEKGLVNKTDIEIADAFGEFWTHFAKHGNPSLKNQWAPVNSTKIKPYFELGLMQRMRLGYRILDQYVWNEVI